MVIHLELYKWYMYNTKSVLENETHKNLWDFEIQMDHLISARRPDLMISYKKKKKKKKKKRTCRKMDFAIPADNRITLKGEKRDQY